MSTSVISDAAILMTTVNSTPAAAAAAETATEVEATCECCRLREECTLAYLETVRERFQGKWLCGLCSEAVKDEMVRSDRLISTEEAVNRHFSFCNKFRSSGPPPNPTQHLVSAFRQILRKSLGSPKSVRSMPSSPTRSGRFRLGGDGGALIRSESCLPSLNLVDSVVAGFDDDVEIQANSSDEI
ncbi:OLC1v1015160C1 [Oldenlandia corymbosa var. corymbosa]|uniref:OLC1v1015160C1 n=1 Tax=Oldenlandia corymbosa var. corymbosa TaxID=529605 RepID=A0AAV1E682_OLDCO|nr:OLC1v1015160C1 [Oldenlandia corymbosa var. corymbosa]